MIEENPDLEHDGYGELIYLRKGSKEYEVRENYFYSKTVTVSDINELVTNLESNTKIILKEGTYNFSDFNVDGDSNDSVEYDSEDDFSGYFVYT